jgi:predicted RNase H-like HicB family nuclease
MRRRVALSLYCIIGRRQIQVRFPREHPKSRAVLVICNSGLFKRVRSAIQGGPVVKDSARYVKLVEWSDEDGCFVGQCPGIIGPCCHGDDEANVYAELCRIVEEWIETMKARGQPLPPTTIRRNIVGKILSEVSVSRENSS